MSNQRGRIRAGLAVACLTALGVALIVVASLRGPGMSPDSIAYASMARSFARSGEFIPYFSETPVTIWPPGLPFALAVLLLVGISTPTAAVLLNVASFIACIVLTYLLAARTLRSRGWAIFVVAVVSLSGSTIALFNMLWSEPLFTALILLTLLLLVGLLQDDASRRMPKGVVIGVCCAVSAACLIRFVGITLIPVVALGIYLATRRRGHGHLRGLLTGAVAGALSSVGFAAVAVRNISLGAPPLGARLASKTDLEGVVIHTFRGLGQFIFLDPSWYDAQLTAGIILVGIIAFGAATSLNQARNELYVIMAFAGVWWAALFYSELTTYLDAISMRLAYPAFIPMVIVATVGIRRMYHGDIRAGERASLRTLIRRPLVIVVALGVLALMLVIAVTCAQDRAQNGYRYSRPVSLSSPLAAAVGRLPNSARVASNDSAKIYWDSAHRPAFRFYLSSTKVTPARLSSAAASAVKSHNVQYIALYTKREVKVERGCTTHGVRLQVVSSFREGALVRVTSCR